MAISEERKAKLIEKHRDINADWMWWDAAYDDFKSICTILGIDLDKNEPSFSGFWSQGDGASFTGSFSPRDILDAPAKMREHAPRDEELHRIADELCELNIIYLAKFLGTIRRSAAHYCHSNTMISEIELSDEEEDFWPDEVFGIVDASFQQLMRDLADWLYEALENEHDHRTSDEEVWEAIVANELDEEEEEEDEDGDGDGDAA